MRDAMGRKEKEMEGADKFYLQLLGFSMDFKSFFFFFQTERGQKRR